ncbi:MAG: glycosyl hydrolase family 17 protein [Candidatus Gottesmanbacteria bacterium]|nr:glycosyl hydrolase family 17 protein [Candidatus Gottesmanbacteria bacterium]
MVTAETEKNTTAKVTRRDFLKFAAYLPGGLALVSIFRKLNLIKPEAAAQYSVYLPIVSNGEILNPEVSVLGIGYSPYRDGQNPDWGPYPSVDDIREDIGILDSTILCPHVKQEPITEIRTYGSDHNAEKIPQLILEKGSSLKINAGCWLGNDLDVNEKMIVALVEEANNFPNVTAVTVGNETQQFQTIPEQKLIEYIRRVKSQIPQNVKVTTGDTWYSWLTHPNIAAEVDFIFAHFFPYWEPTPVPVNEAVSFIKEKYHLLQRTYPSKKIVIGETGWPSAGEPRETAIPSLQNQNQFLSEFVSWATTEGVSFYFFEAFDEKWKEKYEGEVGAHWGIYGSNRIRKS